ncbi:hypothetical protein [Afifella sp. YEN Y35]|uniref:hypothetical protein n=1 Tax=Afifella sp. YEN Y35 TaxID=3388337 RepID=UPI0039E144A1
MIERWLPLFRIMATALAVVFTLVWYLEKRRGADFEPVVVAQCTTEACVDASADTANVFRSAGRRGFNPWPEVDYCARSLEILSQTPPGAAARFVPEAMAAEGLLQLKPSQGGVFVAPGPAIQGAFAPFRMMIERGGAPSCYRSSFEPWLYLVLLLAALLWWAPWPRGRTSRPDL